MDYIYVSLCVGLLGKNLGPPGGRGGRKVQKSGEDLERFLSHVGSLERSDTVEILGQLGLLLSANPRSIGLLLIPITIWFSCCFSATSPGGPQGWAGPGLNHGYHDALSISAGTPHLHC